MLKISIIFFQNFRTKIGQFFLPAVFINDSEENIQAMERLDVIRLFMSRQRYQL
jgi:hypothetical protein